METACKHSCRRHRLDARWMLRLLMFLWLHCCREGAVAQSDQIMMPEETDIFFLESTVFLVSIPVTTHTSVTVMPTASPQPFLSSTGGRASSTAAAIQPQPSSFGTPSSTVSVTQVEPSLQDSGLLSQATSSLGPISTTISLRTSMMLVPSSSTLPTSFLQLSPSTSSSVVVQSTQQPMLTSSTDAVSLSTSSSTSTIEPSLTLLQSSALSSSRSIGIASVQPSTSVPPAEAPTTTSVDSQSPIPSQPSTSALLPVESSTQPPASTTSVDSPSPLPPQPTTSTLLPVESSTQPPAEPPATTPVDSPSLLLTQLSTSMLPPVLTSSVPEPSTTSVSSTEPSAEPTSSLAPSSPSAMLTTVIEVLPSSSAILPVLSTQILQVPTSSAILPAVSTQIQLPQVPSSSAILPVLSTQIQPPQVLPSSSAIPPVAPTNSTNPTTGTTDPGTTPQDEPTSFLTLPVIVGISGGSVIAILLLVILILCCCCICSQVRKRRRYSIRYSAEDPTSIFANGQYPQKRRESNGSVQAYELNFIHVENPTYEESEDHLRNPTSQVSATGTDLYHESSLRGLSPLSYNSQVMGVDGLYQLSVDHPNEEGLSSVNARASLLGKFPHSSPSLAVPTRMGLSLEKEETKSSHGSRTSIPGSSKLPSYQSSKASIIGSKHSIQSSRSSFLNSTHSRDDMKPLFLGRQNSSSPEDDFLSAHLSGRTGSPMLRGDTIESPTDDSLVPTRDSPLSVPLATSHVLKEGKKDFASLTCIPNQQAIADEFGFDFLQEPLSESTPKFGGQGRELSRSVPYDSHAPEAIMSSPQRKGGSKINLGALTTLEQEPKNEAVKPTDATDSATPRTMSEPLPKTPDGSKANARKESPKSSPAAKKPKSRAMSKLEKLTSLDYIRASLRLKKKKVSFQKTPESAIPKSKKKKPGEPEPIVLTNTAAAAAASAGGENVLESPNEQSPVPYPEPKRPPAKSDAQRPIEDDILSPDIYPEDFGGGFQRHYAGRPRTYSDMPYPQLSQPTYFPGHMGGGQYQSTYPQLSQQYYPQLSQGAYYPPHLPYPHARAPLPLPSHSLPPQPSPAHQTSGGSGGEPYGRRFSDAALLGAGRYPDMVTPDAYLPPNHDRFRDIPSPDRFTDNSSFMDQYPGARSPDRFTETSNTSERYQAASPDGYFGRYRDVRSPDRWTDSSYSNSVRYDEPVSPTRFSYAAPERFIDDRHRGSKEHLLEMDTGRQPHHSGSRLLENFDSGRRYSLEMHNRYPDGMDSGRRNSLQRGQPDRPGRDAVHKRQHSSDIMDSERRPSLQGRLPDRYSDSSRDQEIRSPGRYSTYSDTSTSDKFTDTSAPKSHVSWSTEVIEYTRTPSPDMEYGSDYDAL